MGDSGSVKTCFCTTELCKPDGVMQPTSPNPKPQTSGNPLNTNPASSPLNTNPSGSPSNTNPSGRPSNTNPSGSPSNTNPSGSPSNTSPSGSPKKKRQCFRQSGIFSVIDCHLMCCCQFSNVIRQ